MVPDSSDPIMETKAPMPTIPTSNGRDDSKWVKQSVCGVMSGVLDLSNLLADAADDDQVRQQIEPDDDRHANDHCPGNRSLWPVHIIRRQGRQFETRIAQNINTKAPPKLTVPPVKNGLKLPDTWPGWRA